MPGTYNGKIYGGKYSTAAYGFIYTISMYNILQHGGPPADGGHPGGRRAGGHYGGRRAGGHSGGRYATGGHITNAHATGEGGYGGSPNAEAGKMYQHTRRGGRSICWLKRGMRLLYSRALIKNGKLKRVPCNAPQVGPKSLEDANRCGVDLSPNSIFLPPQPAEVKGA